LIQSCDVGSLPYPRGKEKLLEGSSHILTSSMGKFAKHFEKTIVDAFMDKINAGISLPAFPQFRDMNKMFLSMFEGIKKIKDGYIETNGLSLKSGMERLAEVAVIAQNTEKIFAQVNKPFQLRICITGPYTLASFFPYRNSQTYARLGRVLSEIVEKNTFKAKKGKVALIAIDEPLFGFIDDPLLDRGAEGRENLLEAWESIGSKALSKNIPASIHLHCTSNDLFWKVKSLKIIESHVDDPLYEMKTTKHMLEEKDKILKASIAIADFDKLIKEKLGGSNVFSEVVADAWKEISNGKGNPEIFVEDVGVMKKRLTQVVERFGLERVMFAGPECGLRGFPDYATAMECLRRVSKTVGAFDE
jgi:5-methyltetrahydropteroyltriglutamate--homocysteine methyltransferase